MPLSTPEIANALVILVGAIAPLALKHVSFDGKRMVAVSYGVAFALAAIAGYLSGEFKPDVSSVPALLASSTAVWGLMQGVYQLLKDHDTFGPYVK